MVALVVVAVVVVVVVVVVASVVVSSSSCPSVVPRPSGELDVLLQLLVDYQVPRPLVLVHRIFRSLCFFLFLLLLFTFSLSHSLPSSCLVGSGDVLGHAGGGCSGGGGSGRREFF